MHSKCFHIFKHQLTAKLLSYLNHWISVIQISVWPKSPEITDFFCPDCFCRQERHRDHFGGMVVSVCVSNVKSMHLALFLKHQGSRHLKLHKYIHHDAPCPLPLTVTGLDLPVLLILGWTMFSLCVKLRFLNTTSSHRIAIRQISWLLKKVLIMFIYFIFFMFETFSFHFRIKYCKLMINLLAPVSIESSQR